MQRFSCALLLARRLDHHAHERLGAGRAYQDPAPALERVLTRARRPPRPRRRPRAPRGRARARSRAAGAASPSRGDRRGRSPRSASSASSAAAMPSPDGTKPVSMMCPDCSPPSAQPRRSSSASTLRSPTSVVATSIPASRHRPVEAVVGHHGHGHAVARQPAAARAGGARRAPSARRRRRPSPLRSTASTRSPSPSKANPTSWPPSMRSASASTCVEPQSVVDVAAVGLHRHRVDVGAQPAEDLGRHAVGGAVRAVEQDAHAAEVEVREAQLELAQVVAAPRRAARARGRCAGRLGSSSRRSISASWASPSFVPSGPKNLIPLSWYGLCEAETTAARSKP